MTNSNSGRIAYPSGHRHFLPPSCTGNGVAASRFLNFEVVIEVGKNFQPEEVAISVLFDNNMMGGEWVGEVCLRNVSGITLSICCHANCMTGFR